jgi:ankyrin repeat protein
VDELLKEGLVAKRPLSDDESFAPFYDAIWGESEGGTAAPQGEVGADAGVLNRANAWVMMARGFTPIHFAALAGRADKIRRLVEVGVDVNIEAAAGSTPLVCAAFAGKREAVELLLQLGADPALRHHPTGFDAAAWASHRGHLEIADLLLNHLGDFSQGLPADVARGLVLAAASAGDAGQLGGFVSRIEASEERSQLLQDALTYAATRSAACAQLLVDAGASPVMQDSDGRVSLVIAAQADDAAILRVLLDKGGADDVDAADKWGRTALAMAAEAGHVDHVSLLIERGADLDAGDDDGRTPLIRAALNGKDAIVKLLVDAGSKLDAADKAGHTALMMAIAGSTESTVRLLLGLGANPHAADKKNSTVLMHAVGQGQEGIVQLLLSDHRADGRIANASGHTPLMAAARKGQYPIVLLLLNALDESERQAVDKKGWTALCHAGYAGHGSIVRLLQEQGASLPLWTEYVVNDGRQDAVSGTPQIEWLRGDRLAASIREPLIASTDKPWPMAPIVGEADEWTVLGREEAATLIEELVRALNRDSQWINSGPVTRVRTFQPLFYPDALLCEAESCGLDGVEGLITFCKSAHGCVLLDGTSQPIHKLNIVGTVDLSRADNVRQFAKFFCTAVQGDESSFTLLESPAELDFTRALTTAEQYQLPIHVGASTPPRESLDQKSWSLESNVSYGNRLFRAEFQVWKSGFVSMTDDQQLMESLPVVAQGFSANARRRFIP